MQTTTQTKLDMKTVLEQHRAWARGESGGKRADLSCAYLRSAYLRSAYLSGADLSGADADLRSADLSGAILRGERDAPDAVKVASGARPVLGSARGYDFVAIECEDGPWLRFGCEFHSVKDWKKNLNAICELHEPDRGFPKTIRAVLGLYASTVE